MLDYGCIHLVQPVDGSHCCEDGLRLFSQNTALCVAECIPHSFFTNSILMFFTVFMSLQIWGSKICTPVCWCKGVCLFRFPTKIAAHCLLFIAQPCLILQPSFLESSWFFGFLWSSLVNCFFQINTLLMFCIIFLWFSLDWSKKALYCSNTFLMWHVKDCQVHSPCLVEDEMYMYMSSRAWLKLDLRMNFKRTTCDKILFPHSVVACNFCTELNLFMCASI